LASILRATPVAAPMLRDVRRGKEYEYPPLPTQPGLRWLRDACAPAEAEVLARQLAGTARHGSAFPGSSIIGERDPVPAELTAA
jgi:hypothetical protein